MTVDSLGNNDFQSPLPVLQPLTQTQSNKARYHIVDSRKEPSSLVDEYVQRQARSIACFVEETSLFKIREDNFKLRGQSFKQSLAPLGKKVPFRNQITPALGTAFLVDWQGKRCLMTAAHMVCDTDTGKIDREKINSRRIIFDFQTDHKGKIIKKIYQEKEIYRISKVVAHYALDRSADWALLELDKEVNDREPLKYNIESLKEGTPLHILGYPCGLPLKYAEGSIKAQNSDYFEADLDAFGGNSGSPVFNKETGEVCGILVRGNEDYEKVYDRNRKKWSWNDHLVSQKEIDKNGFEKIQRLGPIEQKFSSLKLIDIGKLQPLEQKKRVCERQEKAEPSRQVRQVRDRTLRLSFYHSM